ncbi:MAG TPA: efflux RND transporter periplasmic adaptor subunit, partial [Stellaceae bacterium]|nr:efflux RND transporter periplasmic adaptor subunit [Stellaceae bacterium]
VQPVEVGQMTNKIAVVTGGLEPGDRVVTAGQYRLQPGARVAIAQAGPAAAVAKTAEATP